MLVVLQVVTATLVSITMALALAHALEFPGKMRLSETEYRTVQTIYYPGFTIGGIGEGLALVALLGLVALTPTGGAAFWLSVAAFIALAMMHGVYWVLTHPVNNFGWKASTWAPPAGASSALARQAAAESRPIGRFCAIAGSIRTSFAPASG